MPSEIKIAFTTIVVLFVAMLAYASLAGCVHHHHIVVPAPSAGVAEELTGSVTPQSHPPPIVVTHDYDEYWMSRDPIAVLSSEMALGRAESERPTFYVPASPEVAQPTSPAPTPPSEDYESLRQDVDALLYYFQETNK